MKNLLAVLALCVLAPGVAVAAPDCRSVESTSARLMCYDALYPPTVEKAKAAGKEPARSAYKDPFVAEDATTAARLKSICRGC